MITQNEGKKKADGEKIWMGKGAIIDGVGETWVMG